MQPAKISRFVDCTQHDINDLRNGFVRGIDDDGVRGTDERGNGTAAILTVSQEQILFDIPLVNGVSFCGQLEIPSLCPLLGRSVEEKFDLGVGENH